MNLNSVVLTGNLVRDPEVRETGRDGGTVCKLRLAVNERVRRGDEWQERGNFFNVTVFGGLAENCGEYLEKGRPIAVQGRLRWSAWETDGGERREAVEVIASNVQFLSRASGRAEREKAGEGEGVPARAPSPDPPVEGGDDAPF